MPILFRDVFKATQIEVASGNPWREEASGRFSSRDENASPKKSGELLQSFRSQRPKSKENPLENIVRNERGEDIATISLRESGQGSIKIHNITSLQRGGGRAALKEVLALADAHGITLKLTSFPAGAPKHGGAALSREDLNSWYGQNGFIIDESDDAGRYDRIRKPVATRTFRDVFKATQIEVASGNPWREEASGRFSSPDGAASADGPGASDRDAAQRKATLGKKPTMDDLVEGGWSSPKFDSERPDYNETQVYAWMDEARASASAWERAAEKLIADGTLSPQDADAMGYRGLVSEKWEALPETLYHATTDLAGVERTGLKNAADLDGGQGKTGGLGGGDSNFISFTDSKAVAEQIVTATRELQRVLRGEFTVDDMIATAKAGDYYDALRETFPEWKDDEHVNDVRSGTYTIRPTEISREFPGERFGYLPTRAVAEAKGWVPVEFNPGTDLVRRARVPFTEARFLEARRQLYDRFSIVRETKQGVLWPMWFSPNLPRIRDMDAANMGVIEIKPTKGAMGRRLNALGEWITPSGRHIARQRTISKAVQKYDPLQARDTSGGPTSGQWVAEGTLTTTETDVLPRGKDWQSTTLRELGVHSVDDSTYDVARRRAIINRLQKEGTTFDEARSLISHLRGDIEVAALVDAQGSVTFVKEGKANEVSFSPEELRLMENKTLVHNHPNGTPLSDADIRVALYTRMASIESMSTIVRGPTRTVMDTKALAAGVLATFKTVDDLSFENPMGTHVSSANISDVAGSFLDNVNERLLFASRPSFLAELDPIRGFPERDALSSGYSAYKTHLANRLLAYAFGKPRAYKIDGSAPKRPKKWPAELSFEKMKRGASDGTYAIVEGFRKDQMRRRSAAVTNNP